MTQFDMSLNQKQQNDSDQIIIMENVINFPMSKSDLLGNRKCLDDAFDGAKAGRSRLVRAADGFKLKASVTDTDLHCTIEGRYLILFKRGSFLGAWRADSRGFAWIPAAYQEPSVCCLTVENLISISMDLIGAQLDHHVR